MGRPPMMMGPGGQQIQQLPGGMTREELDKRQELEYDVVMGQHIHLMLVMSGDVVKTCSENEVFEKMPERERIGTQAMLLHSDFARMQVALMETIRKKIKDCQPFASKKDLQLTDIRKKDVDVLWKNEGRRTNVPKCEG